MSEVFSNVESMMTPEQRAKIGQPKAWENTERVMGFPLGAHPAQMTGHCHQLWGIPTPEHPIVPSVSSREQRLRFILEEFLELVEACGFRLVVNDDAEARPSSIPGYVYYPNSEEGPAVMLEHIEGSRYDVVEAADALGDLNVVNNGTAVEWGIPIHFIDYEVYTSNLSKITPDGRTIKNGITEGYRAGDSKMTDWPRENEPGFRPDLPIGKILKPDSFVPCNIPAVLVAYQNKEI